VFGGFGFDIGGRPEHALWACDELQSSRCFTGKPLHMGGTDYDREGIAGLGVAVAGSTLMQINGSEPARAAFAVQGMGAMGAAVLRYFSESGARLTALGDPRYGGTWTFGRPPSSALHEALVRQDVDQAKDMLAQEAMRVSPGAEAVLYQDVDILFPCAVQDVVTQENVDGVRARFVCEGANGPVTEPARTRLHRRGIVLVPDFIANPGGAIAAFVELTSTSTSKAEEAKALARAKIAENVRTMVGLVERHDCEPQHAALYLALSRIRATAP
jgi:glutamate dehydrogenase (NAD(P)+)